MSAVLHYIANQFTEPDSGTYFKTGTSDQKSAISLSVAQCSKDDLNKAKTASLTAFGEWSSYSDYQQGKALFKLYEQFIEHRSWFEDQLAKDGIKGKESSGRVEDILKGMRFYAGLSDKVSYFAGNRIWKSLYQEDIVGTYPKGNISIVSDDTSESIISIIILTMASLSAGNTVLIRGSGAMVRSLNAFAEIIRLCDLPEGLINILYSNHNEEKQWFALQTYSDLCLSTSEDMVELIQNEKVEDSLIADILSLNISTDSKDLVLDPFLIRALSGHKIRSLNVSE